MDPSLRPLAGVALNEKGRTTVERLCADLASLGRDEWAEQYAWLATDLSPDPSEAEILVAIGTRQATIGLVDWAGEDDDHQVEDMVANACRELGLVAPSIPDDIGDQVVQQLGPAAQRGDYVPALLRAIDDRLLATGLRLLLINLSSDTYFFVPVTADSFSAVLGYTGHGYCLEGVDTA